MSLNDRCREAAEALRAGVRIPEGVRTLLIAVFDEGTEGIRFPEGIREASNAIYEEERK